MKTLLMKTSVIDIRKKLNYFNPKTIKVQRMSKYRSKLFSLLKESKLKRRSLLSTPNKKNLEYNQFQHKIDQFDNQVFNKTITSKSSNAKYADQNLLTPTFICEKESKKLALIEKVDDGLLVYLKQTSALFLEIKFKKIKKIISSKNNNFLVRIHFEWTDADFEEATQIVLFEIPNKKALFYLFRKQELENCFLNRKSLDIEAQDKFLNCSLSLLSSSQKQGILEIFVDDFFTDWETCFVCFVPGILYIFKLNDVVVYEKKK